MMTQCILFSQLHPAPANMGVENTQQGKQILGDWESTVGEANP